MFATLNSLTCLVMSIEWTPAGSPKPSTSSPYRSSAPARRGCRKNVTWIRQPLTPTAVKILQRSSWKQTVVAGIRRVDLQEKRQQREIQAATSTSVPGPSPTNCKNTATPESDSLATAAAATETDELANTVHRLHWLVPSTAAVTKKGFSQKWGEKRKYNGIVVKWYNFLCS